MKISTKELRIHPGRIIEQVSLGEEVIVTFRGRPLARILPFRAPEEEEISIFGLWKDHPSGQSVNQEVRDIREGRFVDF